MSLKVAVLIDAENIAPKYAQLILSEASNFGSVVRRRIYGDWSLTTLSSWKTPIMDYSINPIQQFHNTTGKNSSDSALIIDAMDLLHEERYQCVCIVSSDSDFTRLATRLRESEIYVVGMGEQKTPASFRSACDKFLYLDLLEKEEEKKKSESIAADEKGEQVMALRENDQNGLNLQTVIATINGIIDTESDEDQRHSAASRLRDLWRGGCKRTYHHRSPHRQCPRRGCNRTGLPSRTVRTRRREICKWHPGRCRRGRRCPRCPAWKAGPPVSFPRTP
ncbi:MAG: NYN domain-containing protein [Clostridia bacterium]|nr:NYN domain-containing protein [Clostridia bacterium]